MSKTCDLPHSTHRRILAGTLVLMLSAAVSVAQQSSPSQGTVPDTASTGFLAAARQNFLADKDLKPWHLKASFVHLDDSGKEVGRGAYEEFWAGPGKNRLTFTDGHGVWTQFYLDGKILRTGSPDQIGAPAIEVARELVNTFDGLYQWSGGADHFLSNDSKLDCYRPKGLPANPGLTYCFEVEKPILRLSVIGFESEQIAHDRILEFQGRFLAGDLQFTRNGKTVLTAHVDQIELLDPVDDALFTPPPDARPLSRKYNIPARAALQMIEKHPAPEYPPQAISSGLSGMVVLQVSVGVDGRVQEVHAQSGPAILQKPALDAVSKWTYKPYRMNGESVEWTTTVNVVFTLENRRAEVHIAAL